MSCGQTGSGHRISRSSALSRSTADTSEHDPVLRTPTRAFRPAGVNRWMPCLTPCSDRVALARRSRRASSMLAER